MHWDAATGPFLFSKHTAGATKSRDLGLCSPTAVNVLYKHKTVKQSNAVKLSVAWAK